MKLKKLLAFEGNLHLPFLFFLVFTFSLSFLSASPFGYDIDDTPGTYNYQINQTINNYGTINGSVNMLGDNIYNAGNVTPKIDATSTIGTSLLRWLDGWFVNLSITGMLNMNGGTIKNVTSINPIGTTLNIGGDVNITGNIIVNGNFSSRRAFYSGYDNSTQGFISTSLAQVINISNNNDVAAYQISVENRQNVTFQTTGEYLMALSPEFYQSGGSALITFWIQTTNSSGQFNDVAWSNSRYSMVNGAYNAPTIEYSITITSTSQKVRFMWWSDSATSVIYSSGPLTSPTRPSIPGVLLNIRKSSALP